MTVADDLLEGLVASGMKLRGADGTQGPKGEQGDTGPKGDKGNKGDTGPNGKNGTDGKDGEDGVKGDTGPVGPDEKVKIDREDPKAGFLIDKLEAGRGISLRKARTGSALVIDAEPTFIGGGGAGPQGPPGPPGPGGSGAVDSVNGETGVVVLEAAEVPFIPAGTISATNVQAAIEEVAAEAGGGTVATGTGPPTLGVDQGYEIAPDNPPSSGTWTCTFRSQTTAPLAFDITSEDWVTAMEALSSIGAGNIAGPSGRSLANSIRFTFTGTLGDQVVEPPTITNSTDEPTLTNAAIFEETPGVDQTTGTGTNGSRYIDLDTNREYIYLTTLSDWLSLAIPSQWTIGAAGQLTIAVDVPGTVPLRLELDNASTDSQDAIQVVPTDLSGQASAIIDGSGEFESQTSPAGTWSLHGQHVALRGGVALDFTDGDINTENLIFSFLSTAGAPTLVVRGKDANGDVFSATIPMTPA